MSVRIKPNSERGTVSNHWITSRRSFSNNSYWDPKYMRWNQLRAINDDTLQPGYTIPRHSHHDTEIFTYIVQGQMSHWESYFNSTTTLVPGHMQHITSGLGIDHTQTCVGDEPCRYLQVWIEPDQKDKIQNYQVIPVKSEFSELNIQANQHIKISAGWVTSSVITMPKSYGLVIQGSANVDQHVLSEGDVFETDESVTVEGSVQLMLFESVQQ